MFGSIYNLQLSVQGSSQLIKTRNLLKGFGQASYTAFDNATRALNKFDKATGRVINRLGRMAVGGGIAYGALNMLNYSFLQSNSLIKTNTILLEELTGNKTAVKAYMATVQDLSASYGQDMNELMGSAKGLMQVMNQAGKTVPKDLERMLKLVMTTSLLDTENRGLGYVAFSFREMFQGLGRADFRSMKSRLEINFGRTMEDSIVKAIRSKNVTQAVTLIEEAFKSVGIDSNKVMGRILEEGTVQNISRLSNYISRFFQLMGEDSFNALARPLNKLNEYIATYFAIISEYGKDGKVISMKNSAGLQYMIDLSKKLKQQYIEPMVNSFYEMGTVIHRMRSSLWSGFIDSVKGSMSVVQGMFGAFISFTKGLLGISHDFTNYETTFEGLNEFLKDFGHYSNLAGKYLATMIPPVNDLAKSINSLAVSFMKLFSPNALGAEGSAIGALMKGGMGLAGAGIGGLSMIVNGIASAPMASTIATMAMGGMLGKFAFGRMFGRGASANVAGGVGAGSVAGAGAGVAGNVGRNAGVPSLTSNNPLITPTDAILLSQMFMGSRERQFNAGLPSKEIQAKIMANQKRIDKLDYNRRNIQARMGSVTDSGQKAILKSQLRNFKKQQTRLEKQNIKNKANLNTSLDTTYEKRQVQINRQNAMKKVLEAPKPVFGFKEGLKGFLKSPLTREVGGQLGIMVAFQAVASKMSGGLSKATASAGGFLSKMWTFHPMFIAIGIGASALGVALLAFTKAQEEVVRKNQELIAEMKKDLPQGRVSQSMWGEKMIPYSTKFKELSEKYGSEKAMLAIKQVVLSGKGKGWMPFLDQLTSQVDPSGNKRKYNKMEEWQRLGATDEDFMRMFGGTARELGGSKSANATYEITIKDEYSDKGRLGKVIDEAVKKYLKENGKENSKAPTATDRINQSLNLFGGQP